MFQMQEQEHELIPRWNHLAAGYHFVTPALHFIAPVNSHVHTQQANENYPIFKTVYSKQRGSR